MAESVFIMLVTWDHLFGRVNSESGSGHHYAPRQVAILRVEAFEGRSPEFSCLICLSASDLPNAS